MARPRPKSRENSARAFRSMPITSIESSTRSSQVSSGRIGRNRAGRNRSKIEARKTVATLIAITPKRAMPRTISIAAMRSDGAIGPARAAASSCGRALANRAGLTRQRLLHRGRRLGEIHLAGVLGLQRGHHAAHVLDRLGAARSDRLADSGLHRRLVHLLGQEALDHDDLGLLLVGEVLAVARLIERDRFV